VVLVLKNDQLEDLVPMADEIEAIEQAYREMGEGSAVNSPRARLRVQAPGKKEGFQYYFNNIMGLVPGMKSMGLRIDSTFSDEVEVGGAKRRIYPGDYVGLVFLFDMDDCTLLSIMDDHYISIFRVGATSGVAAKHLARTDAKVMGLVGSGEQAQTQLLAACAVRKLDKVKVFSPTKANRERFAEIMTEKANVEIVPVTTAEEAVRGSDIVTAATNTVDPVIKGEWLEEGAFVNSIVGGDSYMQRLELDDAVIERSDKIIVGFKQQIFLDKQAEIYPRIQKGLIKEEDLHELGELLTDQCPGRENDKEIILFKNNTGMGIQFAATARVMYEAARKKGIGTELPSELFTTDRKGLTYSP
jgi:alanine dehydrogenase